MQEKVKILKGLKSVLEKEISSGYSNKAIKYGLEKTVSVAIKQFPIWNGFWTQKVLDLVNDYDKKSLDERKIVIDKVYEIIEKAILFYSSENFWNKQLQYIKGIGPKKAKLFEKLEIKTLYDLITYYPREYDDRSKLKKISELKQDEKVTVKVGERRIVPSDMVHKRKYLPPPVKEHVYELEMEKKLKRLVNEEEKQGAKK